MMTKDVKRKLTAILSADVKGYSRLMGDDEKGTVHTLNSYKEIMTGLVQHHRGRVVGTAGDSMLSEFASVVDAVECAVEIQKELRTRNAELPENRKMEFRIGVNLGDVIEDGEQILGDGVNIAARLESLSVAGGICISGTAFDQVRNKLELGYEYLGEQIVKNLALPVRVYRVLMEPEAAGKVIGEKRAKPRQWQRAFLSLVVVLIVVFAVIAIYHFYFRPAPRPIEVASKEKMAFSLPDVPSIAVLPFVNMSGDPKQEFLSDGITEEIITALSKIRNLFVISRQSTFSYKGKPVKAKQVSEELGVRYVLEGSVQRSADRIRINAQLIDALTGHHILAERYDRPITDLFALQDEITMKILTAVQVKLTEGEQAIGYGKARGKVSLDCYLKILEGYKYFHGGNIESTRAARRIAEEAMAMCSESPWANELMGWVYHMEYMLGIGKSPQDSIEKSMEMARKALAIDDSIATVHGLLSLLYVTKEEFDKAIVEGERALALDPGGAFTHSFYATSLTYAGRSEEAIPIFQKAIRLDPGGSPSLYVSFSVALRFTGRFEEAVSALKKALQRSPDYITAHIGLAGTYSLMGREKEARAEAAEVLRLNPKFSLDTFARILPYKDQAQKDLFIDALRKAGLK